jgi:hypothetical protein
VFQRALFKEQAADFGGRRARAEKRAAAAEIIAQEANTARLKALLDAAREQAEVETIRSAEQRFADAKFDWESAQMVFRASAENRHDDDGDGAPPAAEREPHAQNRSWRLAALLVSSVGAVPHRRALFGLAGGAAIAAAGVFLYMNVDRLEGGAPRVADAAVPQPGAPVETAATMFTGIDPAIPGNKAPAVPMIGGEFPAAMEPGATIETGAPNVAPVAITESTVRTPVKPEVRTRRLPVVEMAPTPRRNPYRTVSAETAERRDLFVNDDVE